MPAGDLEEGWLQVSEAGETWLRTESCLCDVVCIRVYKIYAIYSILVHICANGCEFRW